MRAIPINNLLARLSPVQCAATCPVPANEERVSTNGRFVEFIALRALIRIILSL
jgi:hypothetical protein